VGFRKGQSPFVNEGFINPLFLYSSMFFDVHAHLTHERFKKDLEEVVNRARDVIIHCAGSGLRDNEAVLDISEFFPNVKASLGLYPWDAVEMTDAEVDHCFDMIKSKVSRIVSIGEVGLDHHWGRSESDWAKQDWVFEKALELAESINKPLLVHTRKAEKRALELIRLHDVRVIIHSYTGPQNLVNDFLEFGCYFSIPAVVVRSKSFAKLVRKVPVDRLLTETDSPYMAPVSGQRSEPVNVKDGLKKIAELKGLTIKVAEKVLTENYQRLFL
jgi:TatD DNase family protein